MPNELLGIWRREKCILSLNNNMIALYNMLFINKNTYLPTHSKKSESCYSKPTYFLRMASRPILPANVSNIFYFPNCKSGLVVEHLCQVSFKLIYIV